MKSISRPLVVVMAGSLAALAGCASVSGPQTAAPPISPANVLVAGPGDATSQAPESDGTAPLVANNISEDAEQATTQLQNLINKAVQEDTGVKLDPSRTYTINHELVLTKGLKFFDGAGATIKAAIPKGDNPGNVFRFEKDASNMKLTNEAYS